MFKRIALISVLIVPAIVFAYANPGQPGGFVNDFVGLLSTEQKTALEGKLADFEKNSGNEISLAIINSLNGDSIENFAVKLFEDWGIGKEKQDNGVLILVIKDDREMRIEVGYGLEGALTDAQSYWIIKNVMAPAFSSGDFYFGLNGTVDKIIEATNGEYVPSESSDNGGADVNWFFLIFFLPIWLASVLARSKSWWLGGAIGGVAGIIIGFIKGFLYMGLGAMAILIPLGLLFDFFVSKNYQKVRSSGGVPPWWMGGGGKGGGSHFGGFGGGMSGGGGASGRW
jgi:uncharacterized protein